MGSSHDRRDPISDRMPETSAQHRILDILESIVTLLYHRTRQYGILRAIGKRANPLYRGAAGNADHQADTQGRGAGDPADRVDQDDPLNALTAFQVEASTESSLLWRMTCRSLPMALILPVW